mgnify:FL=1|jgi:capsular exopolysaccharide synthesis family protein
MWPWNLRRDRIRPSSPVFETCWKIRTRIEPVLAGKTCPVLTVISAGKGEGKTTTAVNLACTYAQQDKNVLLIDGNLRNPALHKVFDVSNRSGMCNLWSDRVDKGDIVRCSKIPRLALTTSGTYPVDPIELLTSGRIPAFLNAVRREFDLIVIDTPAALKWSDAHILASLGDGALLVVKEGRVRKEAALRLKTEMEQIRVDIVGAVFHQAHRRRTAIG